VKERWKQGGCTVAHSATKGDIVTCAVSRACSSALIAGCRARRACISARCANACCVSCSARSSNLSACESMNQMRHRKSYMCEEHLLLKFIFFIFSASLRWHQADSCTGGTGAKKSHRGATQCQRYNDTETETDAERQHTDSINLRCIRLTDRQRA